MFKKSNQSQYLTFITENQQKDMKFHIYHDFFGQFILSPDAPAFFNHLPIRNPVSIPIGPKNMVCKIIWPVVCKALNTALACSLAKLSCISLAALSKLRLEAIFWLAIKQLLLDCVSDRLQVFLFKFFNGQTCLLLGDYYSLEITFSFLKCKSNLSILSPTVIQPYLLARMMYKKISFTYLKFRQAMMISKCIEEGILCLHSIEFNCHQIVIFISFEQLFEACS